MNPEISPITLESNSAPVSYPRVSGIRMNRQANPRTGSRRSCKVLA
jgi:hypothetical protein